MYETNNTSIIPIETLTKGLGVNGILPYLMNMHDNREELTTETDNPEITEPIKKNPFFC